MKMFIQSLVLIIYFNLALSYTTGEKLMMQNLTNQIEDIEPITTSLWTNLNKKN